MKAMQTLADNVSPEDLQHRMELFRLIWSMAGSPIDPNEAMGAANAACKVLERLKRAK